MRTSNWMAHFNTPESNSKPIEKMFCESGIGRGDGCFVAYSRGSPGVTAGLLSPCELLLGVVTLTSTDAVDKLPTFIEADNINGIKILYEECKTNISIGTLPKHSNFGVARKQLPLRYLKLRKGQTAAVACWEALLWGRHFIEEEMAPPSVKSNQIKYYT